MTLAGPLSIKSESSAAYEIVAGRCDRGLVILCDHASNHVPDRYGGLGLPPHELARHIGYDIGSAGVARRLAQRLGVPAVFSRFSRLLIDPNRGEDDPTLVMRLSDGAIIPGNRTIDAAEREARLASFYRPYHSAIDRMLEQCIAAGFPPAIVSIHSFTHRWRGWPRPWHAAVLWDRDPRLAQPLLRALRSDAALVVGENEPYTGKLQGDTLWRHGLMRGLASAIVELRQDLIGDVRGQECWADRLGTLLEGLLGDQEIRRAFGEVRDYALAEDRRLWDRYDWRGPGERSGRAVRAKSS